MKWTTIPCLASLTSALLLAALAGAAEPRFRTQEIETDLGVGYAVQLVDLTGDGLPEIVIVDQKRVLWYENPTWQRHVMIQDQTTPDNVAIAPYDVDGDGRIDFALGAGWRPPNTTDPGTIGWLQSPADPRARWSVHAIGEEPSVHRLRWVDLEGDGRAELVVAPLQGRGTQAPAWNQQGVRILAYAIPPQPASDPWPLRVLNDELHVVHNLAPVDWDGDRRSDLLLASFEGVHLLRNQGVATWPLLRLGSGNQDPEAQRGGPNRGASEIKPGRLADGRAYLATIEPWHGFQVVVYTPPAGNPPLGEALWQRQVIDQELKWGHAVWCANLDDDADEELVIGVRDRLDDTHLSGVRIYDPSDQGRKWTRQLLDAGGVAVEDLAAADLNGDGRVDLVAVGRQTHNARIYWNEPAP